MEPVRVQNYLIHLQTDAISAYYDETQRLLFVMYFRTLTPTVSADFYRWLGEMAREHPQHVLGARGSVYDFTRVSRFESGTMSSTGRQSQQINQEMNLKNHPVALIARDRMQTELLRVTMKVTPQQHRKRIVANLDEALAYIEEFHQFHRED